MTPALPNGKPWIIILCWNGRNRLPLSLGSLKALRGDVEILVVDNGSIDNSLEEAALILPRAHRIQNGVNLGFAEGNNRGITFALESGATHVALLNDDMALDPGWLEALLLDETVHAGGGIWGGLVLFHDRRDRINSSGIVVDSLFRARDRDFDRPRDTAGRTEAESVIAVTGGAVLIARRVLEAIGGLDARLFAYYEDLDFCLRARHRGFDVRFVPSAVSYHLFAGSQGTRSPRRRYLLARNQMIMVGRYAPPLKAIPLLLAIALYRVLVKMPGALVSGSPGLGLAEARAAFSGLAAAFRELLTDHE